MNESKVLKQVSDLKVGYFSPWMLYRLNRSANFTENAGKFFVLWGS